MSREDLKVIVQHLMKFGNQSPCLLWPCRCLPAAQLSCPAVYSDFPLNKLYEACHVFLGKWRGLSKYMF